MEGSTSLGVNSCLACIIRQPGAIFSQDGQNVPLKKLKQLQTYRMQKKLRNRHVTIPQKNTQRRMLSCASDGNTSTADQFSDRLQLTIWYQLV